MQGGRDPSRREGSFEDRFDDLAALSYEVADRLTGDRGTAEDLCQEALARAYVSWQRVARSWRHHPTRPSRRSPWTDRARS